MAQPRGPAGAAAAEGGGDRDGPAPVRFQQGGLFGYREPGSGRVVLEPRFQKAEPFSSGGVAIVWDGRWALIDRSGKVLVRPLAFDNGADDFAEGLARFADAGKVGFFDERGRIAIPARYGWAGRFSEGRAAVCRGCAEVAVGEHREVHGGRWGYVDRDGKEMVPLRFDRAEPFRGGLATVLLAGRTFWIRLDGNEAVPIDAGR